MYGCKILLMNAATIRKNRNFAKPSLDSLFGIFYLHMHLHKLLILDSFLSEFMCIKFCKILCKIKLFISTNRCIMDALSCSRTHYLWEKYIDIMMPSLNSLFSIPYFWMFFLEIVIQNHFLFAFKILKNWRRLMQKFSKIFAETGAGWVLPVSTCMHWWFEIIETWCSQP